MKKRKNMKRFCLLLALLSISSLILVGCHKSQGKRGYRILATTTPVADMVRNLLGDEAQIEVLMGPGVDPHSYTPSAGDVDKIINSDLLIVSGLHLEGKMGQVFSRLPKKGIGVFYLGDQIDKNSLLKEEEGIYDPHIWWDAKLWAQGVGPLAKFLGETFPHKRQEIDQRALVYKSCLLELDQNTRSKILSIPKERRVLVTGHDAFSYFARAYDMRVLSIQGLNTNDEAGAGKINALAKEMAQKKIPSIFTEKGSSPKNIEVLLEAIGSYGFKSQIGGDLYSDSLGEEGTPQGTYIGAFSANVDRIIEGLKEVD